MKFAIHQNRDFFDHSTTWDRVWIEHCRRSGIPFEIVDCFSRDALAKLRHCDALLWHFSNFSATEMRFARTILAAARQMGLAVFPDTATSWHFDDKIAQSYLLRAVGAPIPAFDVFYSHDAVTEYIRDRQANFPMVAKLAVGSGSSNVRMVADSRDLLEYSRVMFDKGISATPDITLKVASNLRTADGLKTWVRRARRIPDFVGSVRAARGLPKEKGYVYLQDFVPNDGYDLKVVVAGEKLSFCARETRPRDFRASGGGAISYDTSLLTETVIEAAFDTAKALGSQCMGFDFVMDNHTGTPYIIEMSYGFSNEAQLGLGSHFLRDGTRIEAPLNAPVEILENLRTGAGAAERDSTA